jgi:hypothetical protein
LLTPAFLNDDISHRAGDHRLNLCLLGLGHGELVEGLLKIIEKSLPLGGRDPEMLVRPVYFCATGSPACFQG